MGKLIGNLRRCKESEPKFGNSSFRIFQALLASDSCSYGIVESYNILPAKTIQSRSNYQSSPIQAINRQIWLAQEIVCTLDRTCLLHGLTRHVAENL